MVQLGIALHKNKGKNTTILDYRILGNFLKSFSVLHLCLSLNIYCMPAVNKYCSLFHCCLQCACPSLKVYCIALLLYMEIGRPNSLPISRELPFTIKDTGPFHGHLFWRSNIKHSCRLLYLVHFLNLLLQALPMSCVHWQRKSM